MSLVVVLAVPALAKQHDEEAGVVAGGAVELEATVKAVDKEARTVTLEGEGGRTVTVKAGPEVRNFDQIAVGDKVEVNYLEAVAIYVEKSGGAPSAQTGAAVERAPLGAKPAVAAAETVEIKAKVTAIDKKARTVTLQGPAGNSRTIKVDPKVERFDELEVGDDVVVRHTEAIAIAVETPDGD
jgi:Cu/Ag efflux protein CusF